MDALNFGIQELTHQTRMSPCLLPKAALLEKIQACLNRIPTHSPAPLTVEKLRILSVTQVIQTFHQICEHGDRNAALDYLTSYQQLFKGYPQFQAAYFQIARECLLQGHVVDAVCIAGSDKEKQALLDDLFEQAHVPVNPTPLIDFARTLGDEKCRKDYFLRGAAYLILRGAFLEAQDLLEESSNSFESQFHALFPLCPDWDKLQAFADSLNDNALRERCLRISRTYIGSDTADFPGFAGKRQRSWSGLGWKRSRLQ